MEGSPVDVSDGGGGVAAARREYLHQNFTSASHVADTHSFISALVRSAQTSHQGDWTSGIADQNQTVACNIHGADKVDFFAIRIWSFKKIMHMLFR